MARLGADRAAEPPSSSSVPQAGVSDEDAQVYAEGVRRGGTLVTARVNDADATRLEALLARSSLR